MDTMNNVTLSPSQLAIIERAKAMFGKMPNFPVLTREQLRQLDPTSKYPCQWITRNPGLSMGRGMFRLPIDGTMPSMPAVPSNSSMPSSSTLEAKANLVEMPPSTTPAVSEYIPAKDPLFVEFGHYEDIAAIIKSGMFHPFMVTGLSGNGKTFGIEQACAAEGREWFRVAITSETKEADLIGGFRLENGQTVWADGPVVIAMERGAILCLDEVDKGKEALMCLQSVLEGKPLLIKKTNRVVKPAKGFNVCATANTKGQGDATGKFVTSKTLDEAFLERFPITFEQEYPSELVETQILTKLMKSHGDVDADFIVYLVQWAKMIRDTYAQGGCDEIISTRRLTHIVNTWVIFKGNKLKSIEKCCARFDSLTLKTFVDFYRKLDPNPDGKKIVAPPPAPPKQAPQSWKPNPVAPPPAPPKKPGNTQPSNSGSNNTRRPF